MRGEKRIRLIRIFVIPSIVAAGLLIALVPFLVEQSARSQTPWVYSTTKIHIDGNLALAAYCNDPQMDGLSWETAYIIKDQAIDANGIGSPIDISNTTRFLIIQNVSCKNAEPTASAGIRLYNCSYVKIIYCDLLDNGVLDPYGLNTTSNIWLYECHNCTIEENFFSGDGYAGISISESSKNNITSNLFYQNSMKDIYFTGSSQNLIKNNIFKDLSMTGLGSINLENSPNNTILGNEMVSRRSYTLSFSSNSHSNNISGNIMRRNGGGTGAVIRIEQANNNLIVGNSISKRVIRTQKVSTKEVEINGIMAPRGITGVITALNTLPRGITESCGTRPLSSKEEWGQKIISHSCNNPRSTSRFRNGCWTSFQ